MPPRRPAWRYALAAAGAMALVGAAGVDAPKAQVASEIRPDMTPRTLFVLRCAGCHGVNGLGAPTAGVPPFPGSLDTLARDDAGRTYIMHVPGMANSGLSAAQKAEVINYLIKTHGDGAATPAFTEVEVKARIAKTVDDVVAMRRSIVARLQRSGKTVAPYPWP